MLPRPRPKGSESTTGGSATSGAHPEEQAIGAVLDLPLDDARMTRGDGFRLSLV